MLEIEKLLGKRNTIDTTRLKKEHPEIVVGYMKTTTSRVLKI